MKRMKFGKLLLIGMLTGSLIVPVQASSIKDAKDNKQTIESNKTKAESQVKKLEQQQKKIQASIEKLDKKMEALDEKLSGLTQDLKEAKSDLAQTKEELVTAKEDEKIQYATMKKRIKYMYENGETGYLEVIFQADSISDLLNRTEYVAKISEYDHNMLERLKAVRQSIAKAEKQQEKEVAKVTTLKTKVENQQAEVEELVADKKTQVKKYESNIKKQKTLIAKYEKQIDEQDALIARLEEEARKKAEEEAKKKAAEEAKRKAEEAARQQSSGSGSSGSSNSSSSSSNSNNSSSSSSSGKYNGGGFTWPCPSSRNISSPYGYRIHPITGTRKLHNGIDISASYGSSIVAAADGTVIAASYSSSMGNYVMIDHGGGITTVYMHSSRLLVSSGQKVSRGQHIANVGSTGMSTGNHLHFSVRVNGSYVSPWNYL